METKKRAARQISSRYDHHTHPGKSFSGHSLTKQSFAKDADINNIMLRYVKTGVLPEGTRQPIFDDFSSGETFQDMQNQILQAQAEFDQLPSDIRDEFNTPGNLIAYMNDPGNAARCKELGLFPGDPLPAAEPAPENKEPIPVPEP